MNNPLIAIAFGLACLYWGAELLVRSSVALAKRLGVSSLIIGLTIVAFWTSAPELVVSMQAAWKHTGDIALGNVVGSNICNLGLILGISALIRPLRVEIQMIRIDVPILILGSGIMTLMILDNCISTLEGIMLTLMMGLYILLTLHNTRKEKTEIKTPLPPVIPVKRSKTWLDFFLILMGLGLLMLGAHFLVKGGIIAAEYLGVSQAFIGLTVVAAGTSLPELATSLVAAWKGESDISVGNLIGSNLFNLFAILGLSSLVHPIQAPEIKLLDLFYMLALTIVILPLMKTGFTLKRWEGGLLVSGYIVYIILRLP